MGIFDFLKKNTKSADNDLFSIPCDYNSFNLVFERGITDPSLYAEVNNIVTNSNYDISKINEYRQLKIDSDEEEFLNFYDCWQHELMNNKYLCHLDNYNGIENFSKEINEILKQIKSEKTLDINIIIERYKKELANYTMYGKKIESIINFDVLEANIVADELRKIGFELIKLFDGFDCNDTAIITVDRIDDLKKIESKIKKITF